MTPPRISSSSLVSICLLACLCPLLAAQKTCAVRTGAATPAEAALANRDYKAALELFRKMAEDDPGNSLDRSRDGIIRALLGQDKVDEANEVAQQWLKDQPTDGYAVLANGEVQFREGELTEALQSAIAANKLNACLSRAYLLLARYERLSGFYALASKHIDQAHRLDQADPEIGREWSYLLAAAQLGQTQPGNCVAQSIQSAKIPIQSILDGRHYEGAALDVNFNGKRRRLEIDTGAGGILLTRAAAQSLGLIREQHIEASGVGDQGPVASSLSHVDSMRIGNVEFRNCSVEILEKRTPLEIDGVIGGNVFSNFLLTIDYPASQLRLDPLPKRPDEAVATKTAAGVVQTAPEPALHDPFVAPDMKDWTPFYRVGHDIILPVQLGNSRLRLFIVDTGAASMLISPSAAREVTKIDSDYDTHIVGISGEVNKVYQTEKLTLAFAHKQLTVNSMTSIDTSNLSHDTGVEISGFLGDPVLLHLAVHIDYRDNLIKFDYDPKKDARVRSY